MRTWSLIFIASFIFCGFTASSEAQANGGGAVLDNISSQFTASTKKWETSIKGHAVKLFWILAAIAAVWTFILLVLKQADFADLFGAVTRFTFVTFFFYWLLLNGGNSRLRSCNLRSRLVMMPRVRMDWTGAHLYRLGSIFC
jgi:type IV secretory pathway TrbL component